MAKRKHEFISIFTFFFLLKRQSNNLLTFFLFNLLAGTQSHRRLPTVSVTNCQWDGKNLVIKSSDDIISIILIVSVSLVAFFCFGFVLNVFFSVFCRSNEKC